jgi:type II secretory ATPase GspE/PulE/Tfp pilus assembly ATPase PilB-like protein
VLAQVADIFHTDQPEMMRAIHALEQQALDGGIGKLNPSKINKRSTAELSTTDTAISRLWKVHEGGCDTCGHSGYKGRMGIYETLSNSPEIQKLIVTNATSEQIQTQAIREGMVTMQLDGLVKALRGQTTIEEILRVTSEE